MATVETPTLEVRAQARWVHAAPRKAQLVVTEIRGLHVDEALTALAFMTRAAARDVESVLKSAIANAEVNHGLSARELYVSAALVGEGPTLKRWKARARGRVGRIHKRTCHITVRVAPIPGTVPPPAPAATEPAPGRRARAAEPPAAASTPAVEEKPKRAPRRRAAEPAAEAAPAVEEPEAEDAPAEKPKRAPRKTKTEPTAETGEPTAEEEK